MPTTTNGFSSIPTHTRQWILKEKPTGKFNPDKHLELRTTPLFPEGGISCPSNNGKILVRTTHIQVDPTNLLWISSSEATSSERLYVPPTEVGSPLMCGAVARVVKSWSPEFKEGDRIFGYLNWSEYLLLDSDPSRMVQKVQEGVDEGDYLAMGLTALTAWYGMVLTAKVDKEQVKTLVVSGAAGGVGNAVVQIAKNVLGIENVIGIAGTDEKCSFLKSLGCDTTLNYKSPTFISDFISCTPNYIDLYWDNVGGQILDLSIKRIAPNGKVVACGGISGYQSETNPAAISLAAYQALFYQNASILGIIVTRLFADQENLGRALDDLQRWVKEGKVVPVKYVVDVEFETVPSGLDVVFEGRNVGRTVLKLKLK